MTAVQETELVGLGDPTRATQHDQRPVAMQR